MNNLGLRIVTALTLVAGLLALLIYGTKFHLAAVLFFVDRKSVV